MEVDFRVLSCWVFALKVFLLFMFYRISVFSKNVDYISNQVVYHSIWQEVEIHTYVGNYWKLHLYIYIYLYIYPATAIAVAAPLSRLPQRGLRVLYILQQSASFSGPEKRHLRMPLSFPNFAYDPELVSPSSPDTVFT